MWGWEQEHYIRHAKNIDLPHRCWTAVAGRFTERWASKTKLLVLSIWRCLRHWTICLHSFARETWFRVVRQGNPPYADSELTACGRSELNNPAAKSRQLLFFAFWYTAPMEPGHITPMLSLSRVIVIHCSGSALFMACLLGMYSIGTRGRQVSLAPK
jgi:hypothetical protein